MATTPSLINTDYYKDAKARNDKLYDAYAKNRKSLWTSDVNRSNKNRDAELAKSNAQYDATGRQNYINYMKAQRGAADQLNAMGIRGGASESSLIRLGTNYNSNVAANNLARNSAASDIRNNYAQILADLKKAYNEDLAAKRAAYSERADSEAKAEELRQLQYFSQAITNQYKNRAGYENLIKQLQASNDPQKVAKIMLARQAMNNLPEEETTSSGGGGGGGGGYSRSYGGYSSGGSSGGGGGGSTTTSNAQALNDKYRNRAAQGKNPSGMTRSSDGGSSGRKSVSSSYYTGSYRTSPKKSSGSNWWNRLFRR